MVEIKQIPALQVLDHFNAIQAGLERIERKTGNSQRERVIAALISGQAQLWQVTKEDEVLGWAISALYVDHMTGERTLHLWKMWGDGLEDWIEAGMTLWQAKAKECGCDTIAMVSNRAWGPMLKARGFVAVQKWVKGV